MKLLVVESFQHNGFRREGVTLTLSETTLKNEIEKGFHDKKLHGKSRWVSGILNHCTPANESTRSFIEKHSPGSGFEDVEPPEEKDDSNEITELWAEFDAIEKSYDKRWGLTRLRNELIKAKKSIGEQKEAKPRQEAVK